MVEIIELGELKTVDDATHDQCDENGIDGTSCGGKMISVPAIPNYYGRSRRHLMCQNHIHNYWGALAWYEQENNLKRLHGKPYTHIRFYDGSTESENEEFEAQSVGYPGWKDCGCPASKMYVAGDYSRCFEIYCENCEEVEGSSRGMGHGNPGDALIAQICATQMRELLAARTFNPSIDGFRVLNHELLVSSSSSNYSAETFEAMWVGDFDKIKAASRAAKYYLEELESRLKSMEVDVVYKPSKWEIRPVEEIKRNVEVLDRFLNDAFTNSFGSVELKNRYSPPTPTEYADEFTRRFAENFASECESCDEESDGGVYECDCCYQVYCENCFEETVDAGHSPYRGSIDDEWMLITKDPRIEETSTGSSWTGGAICGNCAAEIEAELEDLPPIHEVMEEEQGTANFSMEGQVKKKSNLTELVFAGAIIGLLTVSAMKRN